MGVGARRAYVHDQQETHHKGYVTWPGTRGRGCRTSGTALTLGLLLMGVVGVQVIAPKTLVI